MNADIYRDALKDVVSDAEEKPNELSAIGEMMQRLNQPAFKNNLQQLAEEEQWSHLQMALGTGRRGIEFLTPQNVEGWFLEFLDFAKLIEDVDADPDIKMTQLMNHYNALVVDRFLPALANLLSELQEPYPDPSQVKTQGKIFVKQQSKLIQQQKKIRRHIRTLKPGLSIIGKVFWKASKQALVYSLIIYINFVELTPPQEIANTWNRISSVLGEDTWLSALFRPAMYTSESPNPVSHLWMALSPDKVSVEELMIQPAGWIMGTTHSVFTAMTKFLTSHVAQQVIEFIMDYIVPLISAPLLLASISAFQNPYVWLGLKTVITSLLQKWAIVDMLSLWTMAAYNRLSDWWDLSVTEHQLETRNIKGYQCSRQTMCIPAYTTREARYKELSQCLSSCQ